MKQEIILNAVGNELTIREGKALELKEPQKIAIVGDINTVATFLTRRYAEGNQLAESLQYVDKNKAIVYVDRQNMSIELDLDSENFYGAVVKGSVELSDELKPFCINQNKIFRREELVKVLKFNKIAFDDPEMHFKVITAYQAFKTVANVQVEQKNDVRGNRTNNFDKSVSTDLPETFVLNLPIFKNQEKRRFMVEICLDVTDGSAGFWFESVELKELIEVEKDVIINKQLESCKDLVVVYK